MSNLSSFLLLAATASITAQAAHALPAANTVPAASASTTLIAGSTEALEGRAEVFTPDFGAHQAVYAGGQARASVTLGADNASVPFIAYSAAASGRAFVDLTGQIDYAWSIAGDANDGELIPVTITTLGYIRGSVTAQALDSSTRVTASVNMLGMLISTDFQTYVEGGGLDFQAYGLNAGNRAGPKRVDFAEDGLLSAPGGSITARGDASFSETFSLLVQPNVANRIIMQVGGGAGGTSIYAESEFVSWSLSGYIDPIITIAPEFSSRFSVVQSDIPMVPVPEASTTAMLLAGLGVLASLARRRRTATA